MITERIGSYHLFAIGFRDAKVRDPEEILSDLRGTFSRVGVQLLRADRVAGKEHLFFAAKNAVDSFTGRGRRAKHLSMEFLLFASGQHQIVEAIKLLGVTPSTSKLVVVSLSETKLEPQPFVARVAQLVSGTPDDSVMEFHDSGKIDSLRKGYKIAKKEFDSARVSGETKEMVLKRLVLERSAILALKN